MDCRHPPWPSNKEYLREFNSRAARQRVPLSGNIELTRCCNLRCVHCYLGEQADNIKNKGKELGTDQWTKLIDEMTEAGCLYLLITGGEPLLRKDFPEIYRRAKIKGLLVTVFTNGTLISDHILDLFDELPPRAVEITLYGASAETYEKITRREGSFNRCIKGINRLIDRKIEVKLKTILMRPNLHEFFDIQTMAREWGIKFRFDAAVFPGLDGNKSPIELRVDAKKAVELEFSDEHRFLEWRDFFQRRQGLPVPDTLYSCGAGQTHFHIDAFGSLRPCLMVTNLEYNLTRGSFITGWEEVMPGLRQRKPNNGFLCQRCDKRTLCGFCPAFFNLEKGREELCSEYLCAVGQVRFEKLNEAL